jgi:catechol 2,3-dioxygenase-like lactoylglutathione lyase family enzyme
LVLDGKELTMITILRRLTSLTATLSVAGSALAGSVVDSVGITVRDLDRAVEFYSEVLSFEPVAEWEQAGEDYEHVLGVFGARVRIARLALGQESIELMEFVTPQGRPAPADSRSNDRWFQHVAIIVNDLDRAYRWLREHGVEHASTGPQRLPDWNLDAGGIEAFYFRDPDGNHLEVLEFPAGKGEPRWQSNERLFLGIDHTAIVVANTDDSLRWYRDTLGMQVAGTAENYGPEQERLNNVFGARLRITALRADRGIGIELLEYLAPRTGRAMPVDTLASDDWHWQVNFVRDRLADVDAAVYAVLGRAGAPAYVSPGVVALAAPGRLGRAALTVRDPDGHAAVLWSAAPIVTRPVSGPFLSTVTP